MTLKKKNRHTNSRLLWMWQTGSIVGKEVLIHGKRVRVTGVLKGIPGSCRIDPPLLRIEYWNIAGMRLPAERSETK